MKFTRFLIVIAACVTPAFGQTLPALQFQLKRPTPGEEQRADPARPGPLMDAGDAGVPQPPYPAVGPDGWTLLGPGGLAPSAGSVVACVDWEFGMDSNPGTMAAPYKTTAKGYAQLRDGQDDWLMIRAGRTTTEAFPTWNKSGLSSLKPMVVCSYGQGSRPAVMCGRSRGFEAGAFGATKRAHLALMDLAFVADGNVGNDANAGVQFLGSWSDVLLENLLVQKFHTNIVFQSNRTTELMEDVRVRRCLVLDAFTILSSHSQGSYTAGVNRLLLEECVYDHNGWNESVPGATPTIFRHNIYIQGHGGNYDDCTGVTTRGMIAMRGGATGMQQRPGGTCDDNLFVDNPLNLTFGNDGGTINRCVVVGFRNIDSSNPRGVGFNEVNPTQGSSVRQVSCAAVGPGTGTGNVQGYAPDGGMPVTLDNCASWNWVGPNGQGQPVKTGVTPAVVVLPNCNMQARPPQYDVTVAGYMAFLGAPPSERNTAGLAKLQRAKDRGSWPAHLDARAFNTRVLVGLGVLGQPCYPNCDGSVVAPAVNKDDFTCFLQRYAAGDPWANCDGSTQQPTLNVADFTCFLGKFAAGCGAR